MSKHIEDLEKKITTAINQIKKGTVTPAESKIGLYFKHLKPADEAAHDKLMEEYKIVFADWKKLNP